MTSVPVRPKWLPKFDLPDVPPAGLVLETTPLTPAAHAVFTPEELDRRIGRYREQADRRVPIGSVR